MELRSVSGALLIWVSSGLFIASAVDAAGPMDRLKGVSDHAKVRVSEGPQHLWIGIGIFLVLALVIATAALWAARKKGR